MAETTLWEKIVRNKTSTPQLDFWSTIDVYKKTFADMINDMDKWRNECSNPEQKRLYSIAITKLEEACMFVVKAEKFNS